MNLSMLCGETYFAFEIEGSCVRESFFGPQNVSELLRCDQDWVRVFRRRLRVK